LAHPHVPTAMKPPIFSKLPRLRVKRSLSQPAILALLLALAVPLVASANPLGDVLQAALDHPAVRSRQAQLQAADQDASAATARYFGRGNLLLDQTSYEGKHVVGYFYPGQPTPAILDDNISRVGISYSLPIDLFGVIAASR